MIRAVGRALLLAVPILVIFVAGIWVGGHPVSSGLNQLPEPIAEALGGPGEDERLAEIISILENDYFRTLDAEELEAASIEGVFDSLDDPFTTFLTDEELAALRQRQDGNFVGIGIALVEDEGRAVVDEVFEDGPADEAGVVVGDQIISVDGQSVEDQPLDHVVAQVRGPEGEPVTIGLRSPDEVERTVEIVRATVALRVVRGRIERRGGRAVGVIRLSQFSDGAGEAIRKEIDRLRGQGASAWVLDLRGNGGGLLSESVDVADAFLGKDLEIVSTEGRAESKRVFRTDEPDAAAGQPLALLVNEQSASASEIVAGAIEDHGRGRLVGATTFGKASVQVVRPLSGGGGLRITTARYLTPDGRDINGEGLEPTQAVEDDPATPDRDEVLEAALAAAPA